MQAATRSRPRSDHDQRVAGALFYFVGPQAAGVRASADNLLNHVNYTSIGTVVNAVNYGLYTNTAQMRSMNITMRLRF